MTQATFHWGAASLIAVTALAGSLWWQPRPVLLWNASCSSPVGLYAVTSPARLAVDDMVVAWAPRAARRLGASRAYLPFDVPLVKRVAAVGGDRVCAHRERIFINGRPVAERRERDPSGRPLPWWSGCARLKPRELFLLSPAGPLAFDGRYFGVTRPFEVVGRARLLWAKPAGGLGPG